jgi:hypothetical protein
MTTVINDLRLLGSGNPANVKMLNNSFFSLALLCLVLACAAQEEGMHRMLFIVRRHTKFSK